MIKEINSKKAPAAIGPYSQAIDTNGIIFISGQLPIDPSTKEFVGSDIESQTKQSLENIKSILEEVGLTMNSVVKTVILFNDMNDFVKVNEIYSAYFKKPFPARACYEVSKLPKDALIEIEAVASR